MLFHRSSAHPLIILPILVLLWGVRDTTKADQGVGDHNREVIARPINLIAPALVGLASNNPSNVSKRRSSDAEESEDEEEETPGPEALMAQKALENLQSEILVRVKKDLDSMKGVCRDDLRAMLGIRPSQVQVERPFRSGKEELDFCRRNQYSCCTASEIEEATRLFAKNLDKLKQSFEAVEELLVLFEGEKYKVMVDDIQVDAEDVSDKCGHLDRLQLPSGKQYRLMETDFIREQIEEINSLLVESEFFLKRQGWFYGNFICVACNPKDVNSFVNEPDRVVLRSRMKTCLEILDMYEYEKRLLKVYLLFLKPLADLYTCARNAREQPLEIQNPLPVLDPATVRTMESRFDSCYYQMVPQNKICQEICDKNPLKFEMTHNVREFYARALEFYFPILTQTSIQKFYRTVKQETFDLDASLSVEFFSAAAVVHTNVRFSFGEDGVSVFGNELSKKHETFSK